MKIFRAEEPQVIYVLRIIFEVIWMLLRLNFEIIKALFRVVVPQDRKDVTGDVILVSDFNITFMYT